MAKEPAKKAEKAEARTDGLVALCALVNIDHDGVFYPEGAALAVPAEAAERLVASGSAKEG